MGKLQTLQNSVLRLQMGLGWYTSAEELVTTRTHSACNTVHKLVLVAYHTVLQTYKSKTLGEPTYMSVSYTHLTLPTNREV